MGIGRRIREARERRGLTQEELGRRVGVTGSAITNYEKEVSHPKEGVLYALLEELSVEPNYLFQDCVTMAGGESGLSGEELAHLTQYRQLDAYGREAVDAVLRCEGRRCAAQRDAAETEDEPKTILLPELLQPAAAGYGSAADDETTTQVRVALNRLTRRADYIVRVHGDSMEPQFSDGDRVLVRRQPVVENGEVGVFLRDGERVIKIYRDGALESVNPKYGRMEFRGFSECKGLVLGVLKDEWVSDSDSE